MKNKIYSTKFEEISVNDVLTSREVEKILKVSMVDFIKSERFKIKI